MSASPAAMEHRWGTRVTLDLPAQLQAAGGALLHLSLANASLSGAYVRCGMPLPLLSKVWVRVRTSSAWIEACVVRHDTDGLGLEWIDPGTAAVAALLAPRVARPLRHPHPAQEEWRLPPPPRQSPAIDARQ